MKFKQAFCLVLSSLVLLGCNNNKSEPPAQLDAQVWTTYSTVKVTKGASRNNTFPNLGTSLNVSMMREEYESGQIQITSNFREKISIVYSDLKDESSDKTFPKEKMSVYLQKYIRLAKNEHSKTKQFFTAGEYIPDMLLPYDLAVQADENYVDANSNQGITIDFDSYGVDAGIYTGTIVVSVGTKSFNVPVKVEVWDIAFEGKSKFQTCWLIYNDELFAGELDSSDEMMDTYADFLSKYKANPYVKVGSITPDEFIEDTERMWSIKNYNSVCLPFSYRADYTPTPGCEEIRFIKALVRASNKNNGDGSFDNAGYYTNPNNYLKYAVSYMGAYDEGDINFLANNAGVKAFFKSGGGYDQLLNMAINELTNEGFFANKSNAVANEIKNDIRNIPCVFTNNVGCQDEWVGKLNACFCPVENILASTINVEKYVDSSRNSNGKYWNYTCCNPYYPYPSHHIDDDNLSMRVLGWMDKAYKVSGYLYYEANINTYHETEGINVDPYDTGIRNGNISGDGFIMYPGLRYGSKTPLPSNRLITYRDGLEDFDMLDLYESKIQENAAKYGFSNVQTSLYVQDLYSSLFANAVSYEDHSLVFKAREELAKRIMALENDAAVFYRYTNSASGSNIEVYSNCNLCYQGANRIPATTTEGGYCYSVAVGTEPKTLSISLGKDLAHLTKCEISAYGVKSLFNTSYTGNISVNDASSFQIVDNSLKAEIVSEYKDKGQKIEAKTLNFYPSVMFNETNLANAKLVKLDYSNTSSTQDIELELVFKNDAGVKKIIDSHFCTKGLSKTAYFNLTNVKGLTGTGVLEIRFKNTVFNRDTLLDELAPNKEITISSLELYY